MHVLQVTRPPSYRSVLADPNPCPGNSPEAAKIAAKAPRGMFAQSEEALLL